MPTDFERGAAAMREACAVTMDRLLSGYRYRVDMVRSIRALPIPSDPTPAAAEREWRALNDTPEGMTELVKTAVLYATNRGPGCGTVPAWSVVREVFSVGSTHGTELCRRFGMNPDAAVRRHECVLGATERVAASPGGDARRGEGGGDAD